jgi:hypothetical protein
MPSVQSLGGASPSIATRERHLPTVAAHMSSQLRRPVLPAAVVTSSIRDSAERDFVPLSVIFASAIGMRQRGTVVPLVRSGERRVWRAGCPIRPRLTSSPSSSAGTNHGDRRGGSRRGAGKPDWGHGVAPTAACGPGARAAPAKRPSLTGRWLRLRRFLLRAIILGRAQWSPPLALYLSTRRRRPD